MHLSDEELEEVYDIVYDEVYYGDDSFVYTSESDIAHRALEVMHEELKRRKLR